jgi:hypothetical protein
VSELSDYRRMVEGPIMEAYERRIAALRAEVDRLNAKLAAKCDRLPSPDIYPTDRNNGSGIGDWRNLPEAP